MPSFFRNALLAVGCLVVSACSSPSGGSPSDGLPFVEADSMRSGDLVCRLGNGYFSGIFRRFSGDSERFSHIGVFHREGDSCFVIHADADELTGVGSVKRELLSEFLRGSHDHQFYRFTVDSIRSGVDSIAPISTSPVIPPFIARNWWLSPSIGRLKMVRWSLLSR